MERILIVRFGHLGDVVHALPVAAALRDAFPSARLGWMIEERWIDLIGSGNDRPPSPERPLVDDVHRADTERWRRHPLSPSTWRDMRRFLAELRAASYDAVVDLQGLWKSAVPARWTGSRRRIGFARPRELGANWFYTNRVAVRRAHVVEQNLELVEALTGRPTGPPRFAVPRNAAHEAWCEEQVARRGLTAFAIVSPGAGWGAKLWPAERYGALARALTAQAGLPCLVNVGPDQRRMGEEVVAASQGSAHILECTIGRLVALTRRASLVVGGDTGPVHLAAALGVPVVALFGPTSPERNGPYGERVAVLRSAQSRTSYSHVDHPDEALQSIPPDEAVEAALRLLTLPASGSPIPVPKARP